MSKIEHLKKLGSGSFSLTFLWSIKKGLFVIKFPKTSTESSYKMWFRHMCAENLFFQNYVPKQRVVLLAKYIDFNQEYLIQNYIPGKPLTRDIYDHLPQSEQTAVAKKLAHFFIKLHQQTKSDYIPKTKKQTKPLWLDLLDSEELKIWQAATRLLRKNKPAVSGSCICIGDMKTDHFLYDPKKKTIGIIDFGSIHYAHPSDEFRIPHPIRSHLSLKMIRNMIQFYNKGGHPISLEYIKNDLIISSFREVYENYIGTKISKQEKKRLKTILSEFRSDLDQSF